jgi:hypothetical protein
MTLEERKQLAASMYRPTRCGGQDYVDGVPHYRIGGKLLTLKEYRDLKIRLNPGFKDHILAGLL